MNEYIRPEIADLANRGSVTFSEYENMRMNSYEQELLYPAMTNCCLIRILEKFILPNCQDYHGRKPAITYDESLAVNFVPLLIERLRELTKGESE